MTQKGFGTVEIIITIIVVFIIGYVGWSYYAAPKHSGKTTTTSSKQPPAPTQTTGKTATYNNGIIVPAASQSRASAAGYYCPSWDAKSNQNSPDHCIKLDP